MRKSSSLYVTELVDRSLQKDEVSMIIFILSIILLALLMAILVPVVASVNKHKSKVLSLFCEINDKTVRKLSLRSDRFLMKLQSEDNADEVDSNNDDIFMMVAESGAHRSGSSSSFNQDEEDEFSKQGMTSSGSEFKKRAKKIT